MSETYRASLRTPGGIGAASEIDVPYLGGRVQPEIVVEYGHEEGHRIRRVYRLEDDTAEPVPYVLEAEVRAAGEPRPVAN